jgi:SSS family solute:Na+ symporter
VSVTTVTVVLLILYFGSLKWIASWSHRQARHTVEDFFVVGRGVGVAALTGTLVASIVNGLAVTGTPALFYRGGILYFQMFAIVMGATALMWGFGPRIAAEGARAGVITQGEYFAGCYQSRSVHLLVTAIGLLALVPFVAIQIAGVGKVLSGVTAGAISFEIGVGLCLLSIALYVFYGGARAVVWTDVLQGLVALVFLIFSAIAFSQWIGGLAEGFERVQRLVPEKLVFNQANTPVFIDNLLSWPFAVLLFPHIFQRLFMAREPQRIRSTAAFSFVLLMFVLICILVMAVAATAELYGTLEDPDELVATMYWRHWPAGGVILMLVIFAVAMSTIDSVLLSVGSLVTRDIARGLLGIKLAPAAEFRLARLVTMSFLGLCAVVVLTGIGRGAIVPWVTMSASIATLLIWPLIGTLWKPAARQGAIAAMCLGFVAILTVNFTSLGAQLPVGFATVGFLVGGASFLAVTLLTRGRP